MFAVSVEDFNGATLRLRFVEATMGVDPAPTICEAEFTEVSARPGSTPEKIIFEGRCSMKLNDLVVQWHGESFCYFTLIPKNGAPVSGTAIFGVPPGFSSGGVFRQQS
jgi:hypothetical protein